MEVGAAHPQACTRTSTCPAAGFGLGHSTMRKGLDSMGAGDTRTQAFMASLSAGCKNSMVSKRLMIAIVGAGIGSLAGLLISFLGAGNWALIVGAAVGAVVPLIVLGSPGP